MAAEYKTPEEVVWELGPGPGNLDDLPGKGRHFTYHLSHEVSEEEMHDIYVGVTSNLRARMRSHSKKWWWPMVNCAEFIEQPTRSEAERWERDLIQLYNPDLNVSLGVGRKVKVAR